MQLIITTASFFVSSPRSDLFEAIPIPADLA